MRARPSAIRVIPAAIVLCVLFCRQPLPAMAEPTRAPLPYDRVRTACVEILVDDHLWGSGWIASPDGLVITAAHCVREPGRVEVLWQKRRLSVKRIAVDKGNDLALLRLPKREEPYPALALAKQIPPPSAGVWLVGTPIYRHGVLLEGNFGSGEPTYEWYGNLKLYVHVMHLTATTPPGVSGAPWLDREGRIVALHSGTMTSKDVPVGIGFVVPGSTIEAFLLKRRNAATPTLGSPFEEMWEQGRSVLQRYPPRTEGVLVLKPEVDSPLAKAGVEKWQVITAIDGRAVRYRDDLLTYVRAAKPGDRVALSLLLPDGGGRREVRVTLASLEDR